MMKGKRIAAACAAAVMIFMASGCQADPAENLKDLTVGKDDVQFGSYTWTVLEVEDDRALLITTDIVEKAPYNDTYTSITWEECTLRAHLNGEFLESNFSEAERERILEVTNTNPDNVWFGTEGGNDTQDKVFLLSVEEALTYFGDINTLQVDEEQLNYIVDDAYNDVRIARYEDENTWWWLRSAGNSTKFAATVTHKGILEVGGYFVQSEFGVRPVIWVDTTQG